MKTIFQKIIAVLILSFSLSFISYLPSQPIATAQSFNQTNQQLSSPILVAQSTTTQATSRTENQDLASTYDKLIKDFSGLLSTLVQAFNYLLWPILILIGGLMDNTLIFGAGIEDRLLLIWTQVRNLINLLFAVFLIGVAIYNVLGIKGDGNYALKSVLPKMIITLILINFSFLGSKLVLDAANVATTAVFALPNSVEQGFSEDRFSTIEQAMCSPNSTASKFQNQSINNLANLGNTATQKMCQSGAFTDNAKQFFQGYDKNNAALVMAISFKRLPQILDPSELVIKEANIVNLVINLILVLFLEIVYISAFLALFAVLLARIVVSWVIIAVSPLIVLKWGMKGVNIPGLSVLDSFNVDEQFIKHATAPIKIGFGMSIGYIMLDAFQSIGTPSLWFALGEDFGSVFSGLGTIPELFIGLAAVGIVWKVSFDAADNTFAGVVTKKFRGFMEDAGLGLRNVILKQAPIVPIAQPGRKFGTFSDVIKSKDTLRGGIDSTLRDITGNKPSSSGSSTASAKPTISKEDIQKHLTMRSDLAGPLRNYNVEDTKNFVMNMYSTSANQGISNNYSKERFRSLFTKIEKERMYEGSTVNSSQFKKIQDLVKGNEPLKSEDRTKINQTLEEMVGFKNKSVDERKKMLNERLNNKTK